MQGSRLEDGSPCEWDAQGNKVPKGTVLAWFDKGKPCVGCGKVTPEGQTLIERELLLLHGPDRAEAFIEGERERVRRQIAELGDLCPDCIRKPPKDEG